MFTLILLSIFLPIDVGLAIYFWRLPAQDRDGIFFGHPIDIPVRAKGRRGILVRYRVMVALGFAGVEALALALALGSTRPVSLVYWRLGVFAVQLVLDLSLYAGFAKRAATMAAPEQQQPVVAGLSARSSFSFFRSRLDVLILVATLAPFLVLGFLYPALPEQLPVYSSSPPGYDWATKSLHLVFWRAILVAYLQGMLLILKYCFASATISLSPIRPAEQLVLRQESLRVVNGCWDSFRALLAWTSILDLQLLFRTPGNTRLIAQSGVIAGLIIAIVGLVYVNRIVRVLSVLGRTIQEVAGQVYVRRPIEKGQWRAGGLLYWNREDPALLVQSPFDSEHLSYGLNLANRQAVIVAGYLAVLPVIVAWAIS